MSPTDQVDDWTYSHNYIKHLEAKNVALKLGITLADVD